MFCPTCRTENPDHHNFCRHCGELLLENCPRCGYRPKGKANFCGNCGLALNPGAQYLWLGGQVPARTASVPAPILGSVDTPAPEPEAAPAQTPLDQYIPRELRTKLEASRAGGGMVGERRVVTMLFCDVKGSTEAAGRLDPEEWTEIINGAFEYMIPPVYKYEGIVARLMGDGILAFFGAPIAHEDDPQRAVLTGLDIVDGLTPYRDEIRNRWGMEINVRIGINTGLVVVGAVGSDLRMEYTAMGDAINLAARMEQTADPGTIRIAYDTYRHVAPLFELENLGEIRVKGKEDPVTAYRVLGRKKTAGSTRGIDGLEVEMVGRQEELARLQSVLSDLKRGIGRIVCVIGGAGLGKSRLIQELRKQHPAESDVAWYEIASLSYETGDPYAVFQQLIRRLNGISVGEDPEQFWGKIHALMAQVPDSDPERHTRVFASLFSQADPTGQPPLEGEWFKRELYTVMREIWQARFSSQPTVIVFDDLHWTDPASLDLLLHLLPTVETNPIVLLCAFRPDRSAPSFTLKQTADSEYPHRYTEVNLSPLSLEEGDELVDRLLSIADLPEGLRNRLHERAGGNPFYVEEVVRTLIEKGAIVPEDRTENGVVQRYWRATSESAEIDIPDNLQGLLASRIDRLEEITRQVVQLASVIGRSFYHRVLAEIGKPDDMSVQVVEDQVRRLVRLEMIQEAARVPDIEYRFRNPMMQESAYQTILLKRRREFHRRVGAALEQLFPDQLAELTPQLAYHYAEAQAGAKALEYFTRAGDHAFRLFALEEALRNYDQALAWADRGDPGDKQLIHLHQKRGRTLELLLRHDEALETYQALEQLGEARDSDELRLAGISAQGILHTVARFDLESSREYSEKALTLARAIEDRFTEARSFWSLLLAFTWVDGRQAQDYGSQGLEIARELAAQLEVSNEELELLALLLMDLTIPLIGNGQIPSARDYATEARALFEQIGNLAMTATAAQRQGLAFKAEGNYAEAEEVYDHSTELDRSLGNEGGLIGSSLGLLDIYPQVGKYDAFFERIALVKPIIARATGQPDEVVTLYPVQAYHALGAYERVLQLQDTMFSFIQSESLIWPDLFMCYLVRTQLELGELELAREAFSEIRQDSESVNYMIPLAALLPQVNAELALAEGNWQAALSHVDAFIERIRGDGMLSFLPEKLLTRGRILKAAGQMQAAWEAFREALTLAVQQNACPVLWQAAAHLAEMAQDQGDQSEAQALYEQARMAVDYIADHAGGDDLRAAFLAIPQVETIISKTG